MSLDDRSALLQAQLAALISEMPEALGDLRPLAGNISRTLLFSKEESLR
jgi:hypothetical protein